ncbi:hypothetical protein MSAN_01568500 [Mycena sanguinolenta]|uniref:Uncharacterized protein n=1 Tax=Mycena sanguinolenta TaxID=230812 RepID=A0A8H7CV37_9AGAR|nr:hypothetical protein MSAN_01568500 [Mycena sanguinolenta]
MSQYSSTLLADRRSLPYFPEDRAYYSTSSRVAQWTPEPSRTSHYIPTPASFLPRLPSSTHLASTPPPFTRSSSEARTVSDNAHSTPYADASTASPSPESSLSPPPSTIVKEEQPDDDGFIMDLPVSALPQVLAPPTEVPLRATQASADMRRMMGVFRLNPFAIHARGGRGVLAPWAGGEARPLDEEPRIFEFQLDLLSDEEELKLEDHGYHGALDARKPFSLDTPGLRAFSPDFELGTEYTSDHYQLHHDPEPESNWELGYPSPVGLRPRVVPARPASASA